MINSFEIYNQVVGSLWEKLIGPIDSWFAMEVLNESLSTADESITFFLRYEIVW